jgi:hypothetical protein
MSYKWVTVKGNDGERSYKISEYSDKHYVYSASGDSLGTASSQEDALSIIKSNYGSRVWSVDIGTEQSSSCFPASTLIHTPIGLRKISTINVGEYVTSFAQGRATPCVSTVTRRLEHAKAPIWEIGTSCRSTPIRCTAIHAYLTSRGWIQARQLRIGDELIGILDYGKVPCKVTTISESTSFELVYNLHTAGDHTFVADGFIVHNFSHFRVVRTLWHQLFIDPWVRSELRSRLPFADGV